MMAESAVAAILTSGMTRMKRCFPMSCSHGAGKPEEIHGKESEKMRETKRKQAPRERTGTERNKSGRERTEQYIDDRGMPWRDRSVRHDLE